MTVPAQNNPRTVAVGNGIATQFSFGFLCVEARDLIVTVDDIPVPGSQYTVAGLGQHQGGSVTFASAPASGVQIVMALEVVLSRSTDYQDNGDLFAQTVNLDFDRIWLALQSTNWGLGRALRLGFFDIDGQGAYRARQNRIQDLADPIYGQDAANRQWVQQQIADLATDGSGQVVLDMLADGSSSDLGSGLIAGAGRTVDTIADVRKQRGTKNPHVTAAGYYARGDKGPAFYIYDPSDTTSADNGGTVIVSQYGHRYKQNHPGSVNIDDFGARGNGTADDSLRIQVAFDWASVTGIPLVASAKTYGLKLSQRIAIEGNPSAYTALVVKTRLRLTGAGMGKTIFKLLDNESTAANPKWFNVMTGNTVIEYLQLSNYTVDVNGQNNKIDSPAAPLPGFQCAALMITGSVASVGVDARLNNSVIDQIEVKNNPGVTNIGIGNRYGHPGATGFNVTISRCRFYNSGIDSQDHSSIFGYGDSTLVIGCTFDHPVASTGVRGPIVAVELHGSNNKMIGCTVRNYLQMAWIGAGDEGIRQGIVIADNTAEVGWWGIGTWSDPVLHDNVSDISIHDNFIHVTGATIAHPHLTGAKHGLYLACGYGSNFLRANISGNIFYCTDRTNNIGAYVGADTGSFMQGLLLADNHFSGFSRGVLVGAGAGTIGTIAIKGNVVENCAATTATPTADTRGIEFRNGSALSLHVAGNFISSGDVGVAPRLGIDLASSAGAGRFFMDANDTGDCEVGIQDLMTVSGRRSGMQALTFAGLPTQSTWKVGDVAYLRPAPEIGTAGSKYVVDGWNRMTAGTGNVLNTDWVQRRMLTGN